MTDENNSKSQQTGIDPAESVSPATAASVTAPDNLEIKIVKCRRCGQEMVEGCERCPSCALSVNLATGELPPMPVEWQQERERNQLKAVTKELVNTQASKVLKSSISTNSIFLVIVSLTAAVSLTLGGIYLYNLYHLKNKVTDQVIAEYPHLHAIKMVQQSQSSTQGLTVEKSAEQLAKNEMASDYYWWSTPDKIEGQFTVVFSFTKDNKRKSAIWVVWPQRNSLKAENRLAQQLSGR